MWVVWLVAGLGDWYVGLLVDRLFSGFVDWSVGSLAGLFFSRLAGWSVISSVRWLVSPSFILSVSSSILIFVGHSCCCVFHLVRRSPGLVVCMDGLSIVQSVVW